MYQIKQHGDIYRINENGKPFLTPDGNPMESRFKDLLENVVADLESFGADPNGPQSWYTILLSYIDFGLSLPVEKLISGVLERLPHEIIWKLPAHPILAFNRGQLYHTTLLKRIGIHPAKRIPDEDIMQIILPELRQLSRRQIMVSLLFAFNLNSPLLGLSVAKGEADLEDIGFAYCMLPQAKLEENNARGFMDGPLEEDPRFYLPADPNMEFCKKLCLRDEDSDFEEEEEEEEQAVPSMKEGCAMYRLMEKFSRFAQYPDEGIEAVKTGAGEGHDGCECEKHMQEAAVCLRRGDYEGAIGPLNRAIAVCPENYKAWSNKGICLSEQGSEQEALICYTRAVDLEAGYAFGWNNKAICLAKLGNLEQALPCVERAIELDDSYATALANKGLILADLGRHKEALLWFDKSLMLEPNNARIQRRRGESKEKAAEKSSFLGRCKTLFWKELI